MNPWLVVLRIFSLLVEFGVTALGLIMAIDLHGRSRSWWSAVPGLEDYLAWALVANIILAIVLALRFEQRRWIRILSLVLHISLVLVFAIGMVTWYLDVFPD